MTALNDARPVLIVCDDQIAKQCRMGWYAQQDVARARVKAADLGLTSVEILLEQLGALALTLPRGRFLADGNLDLDHVNREVIDRLFALRAADQPKGENQPGADTSSSSGETGILTSQDAKSTPVMITGTVRIGDGNRKAPAQGATAQGGPPRLPAQPSKPTTSVSKSTASGGAAPKLADLVDELWPKITIGSLVIAQEDDREDGWWEAIVVAKRGSTLTLRWRDYPKLPLITRKLKDVALLHPKASV